MRHVARIGIFGATVLLMLAGPTAAVAQSTVLMIFCNHPGHANPKGQRVEGTYYRIADCDKAAAAHRANHGVTQQYFYVQCSWRKPDGSY